MTTKERNAKYHQEHHAEILARKKLYRETHKEQIKLYNATHSRKTKSDKTRKVREYALYKGDDFLDLGSKFELGEKYGLSPDFIAWTTTPSGEKHCNCPDYQGYVAIRVGFVGYDDEDTDDE